MKEEKVEITVAQGQLLFERATHFSLPEKLGDQKYDVAERGLATEDVRELWKELRSWSPLYTRKKLVLFGPDSAWEDQGSQNGAQQKYRVSDDSATVEIRLTKEARSGAFWCLLTALHPESALAVGASRREESAWPLASKFRLVGELKKETGLDRARRRELVLDVPKAASEPVAENTEQ